MILKILEAFGEPISYGGQESFVINLIQHMDLSGFRVDFLTPYYCDNIYYEKIIKESGGNLYTLGKKFQPGKNRFNINMSINKFFINNKYDIVHIHSGSISILGIITYYAKKTGVKKIIVHSHSGIEKQNLRNTILKKCCSFFLRNRVNYYCACSKLAGAAKFDDNIQHKKLLIVKNGVDLEKFTYNKEKRNYLRKQLNIDAKCLLIGNVGRFSYEKNHDFLIDVFYEVMKQIDNIKLILIGNGPLENAIREKVRKLNIENKVIFCGVVNNVYDYLQAMDVFLFPSKFEGLGLACVEAQAVGLDCFVSDKCSSELKITELVQYLSLNIGAKKWAKCIIEQQNTIKRSDKGAELLKAGYDIKTTAEFVRKLYLN